MQVGTAVPAGQLCRLQAGAPPRAYSHCAGYGRQLWLRCAKPKRCWPLGQGLQCADPCSAAGCKGLPWCSPGQEHRHASLGRGQQYTCPCSAQGRAAGLSQCREAHSYRHVCNRQWLQFNRPCSACAGLAGISVWLSHIGMNSQAGTTLHLAKWCWVRRLALVQAC